MRLEVYLCACAVGALRVLLSFPVQIRPWPSVHFFNCGSMLNGMRSMADGWGRNNLEEDV